MVMIHRITVHASELVHLICPGCHQLARRKRVNGTLVGLENGTFTCAHCNWTGPQSELTREVSH
jgi:hypothetical protein